MKNKERICAVVVTYNRKTLLKKTLESLRKQKRPLDGIVLIDNASTDGTDQLLKEEGYISGINHLIKGNYLEERSKIKNFSGDKEIDFLYIRLPENIGGAGGFHEGIKRAYKEGYDWFWFIDDDIIVFEDALENLLAYSHISSCINPSKIWPNGDIHPWNGYWCEKFLIFEKKEENFKDKGYTFVNHGCFEGMLIHRKIVEKIGFPERDFFIQADDILYGIKANKYTNVIYIKDICVKKLIDARDKKPSSMTLFYFCRNLIWTAKEVINSKPFFALFLFLHFMRSLKYVVKYKSIAPLLGFFKGLKR